MIDRNPVTFDIDNDKYLIDARGVIHHTNFRLFKYDASYVKTYDTPAYRKESERLQALRLGFVIGAHGTVPNYLVDVGYGNGDFLKAAAGVVGKSVYGSDISGVQIPGISTGIGYPTADVYTFHDCLEHIPDLSFLSSLFTQTIVVSLPYCHYRNLGNDLEWFKDWKHRKPNEHLHHFDELSLARTMAHYGWAHVAGVSNHEDLVRRPVDHMQNILTMAFKKA